MSKNFVYDLAGNLIQRTYNNGEVLNFGYNAGGRLISVTNPSGTVNQSYQYNALGQRVGITTNGVKQQLHYDSIGQLIAISDAAGVTQREYLYLNGQKVAMLVEE